MISKTQDKNNQFTDKLAVTQNACKLCTPLGASFAFKGIEGAISFLHGSQGCSTYIRRYMISHFKEPLDIASSNFSEHSAIFGGAKNIKTGLKNIILQYAPKLIGVATTCLSETIGDNIQMLLNEFKNENKNEIQLPYLVPVSTASYRGTHAEGFNDAVCATVKTLANADCERGDFLNIIPGMISPSDIRWLKELFEDIKLDANVLLDYSESLDGGPWKEYMRIPEGGTKISDIERSPGAKASIEFSTLNTQERKSAGVWLEENHKVKNVPLSLPIGIDETDAFFDALEENFDIRIPEKYYKRRERLIDSYADGHKYVFGRRALIYGEEDLVTALAGFLDEIGIVPVLCATGAKTRNLRGRIEAKVDNMEDVHVRDGFDFVEMTDEAEKLGIDIIIGNSKGFKTAKKLGVPFVRVGFPIHDRFGGARIRTLGYEGSQELFDKIVNAIIEEKQNASEVGYTYI